MARSDVPRPAISSHLIRKPYVITFSYKLLEESCFSSRFLSACKQDPSDSLGGILNFPPASQKMYFIQAIRNP